MPPCSIRFSASLIAPPGCRYRPYFWFAVLAMLGGLLSPAAVLAQKRAITLRGDGGDAWTFEKNLEGELPDGGCDEVLLASPSATVEAWRADGRSGAIVPPARGRQRGAGDLSPG